jgi:hypothetical protein
MNPKEFGMYSAAIGGDPLRLAQLSLTQPGFGTSSVTGLNGQQIGIQSMIMSGNADWSPTKGFTGLPWGTTSIATPSVSAGQMATKLWGSGQGYSTGAMNAITQGGIRGYQDYTFELGYQNQMASIGIQYQQIALQEKYQPKFWALEDRSRKLGYEQQEWQMDFSQRQLDSSDKWFHANEGMSRRQTTYQRKWQKEDWGYQDQTRDLQWGWKQEDFQENVRFMTGRQRRLAERQMGRDTTMFNLEGDQIDKQRSRQEVLWKLEDERFKKSREQHEEQMEFQQEALDKQRHYYLENKKLQEERIKLEREQWKEQIQLQKASLGIQAAYAREMHAAEKTMRQLSRAAEDARGEVNLLTAESFADLATQVLYGSEVIKIYTAHIQELNEAFGAFGVPAAANRSSAGEDVPADNDDNSDYTPRAGGGAVTVGRMYRVNEYGKEYFKPNQSGQIVPMGGSKNPWGNTVVSGGGRGPAGGSTVIIVQIGNETLGKYVIDAVKKNIEV